jgi:2-methylisocitrate lyase-like PEP mutase family enzyme
MKVEGTATKRMTTVLREMLAKPGLIVGCGTYGPLPAKIMERVGFNMVTLGGYDLGAHLVTSEPLMCLEEVVRAARYITAAINIPLKVDAGAGFGEPLHVMRTVQEFESAGVAAIQIEDQIFPKRAHYHKGIEHIVPMEDMVAKLKAAQAARRDPDLLITARTDAMRTHGFAEGVKRANLYLEAGADMAHIFPNNIEEARQAPKEIAGPVSTLNSVGNLLDRPLLTNRELEEMGYKMVNQGIWATIVAAKAVKEMAEKIYTLQRPVMDAEEMRTMRRYIEDTIGLNRMYEIEKETVED